MGADALAFARQQRLPQAVREETALKHVREDMDILSVSFETETISYSCLASKSLLLHGAELPSLHDLPDQHLCFLAPGTELGNQEPRFLQVAVQGT